MSLIQIPNFLDEPERDQALRWALQSINQFDEYNNPFERKLTLPKGSSSDVGTYFAELIRPYLIRSYSSWWVSRLLQVPISHSDWTHYGGVFIYRPGDYLKPHVDAGVHPRNGLRKVATACLYLTQANLEFWYGEPAYYSKPSVSYPSQLIQAKPGDLVLFTNDDLAWHSVPLLPDDSPERVVITVSYLAPAEFKSSDSSYTNPRTRAYFARLDSDPIDPVLEQLREQRASEVGHESVYKV